MGLYIIYKGINCYRFVVTDLLLIKLLCYYIDVCLDIQSALYLYLESWLKL